ncbi:MAG: FAD binding domain-containing protein [Thermoleophilia bacterium]|nr:FAD binding domain-containing protein [Thermoleophilia bacterium]
MQKFQHIDAQTLDEATALLRKPEAQIIAGGIDLLGLLKDEALPFYPSTLVNIKSVPGLEYINMSNGALRIGALTKLADIARHSVIRSEFHALARAAELVGSPQVREMATIGGNLCQLPRCWYFRSARNRFFCLRKGGKRCPASTGDSRYHSIFGRLNGCYAVNCSDLAPVLVVLQAKIATTKRVVSAEDFFAVNGWKTTILVDDEIVTEIQIPYMGTEQRTSFAKYALRKAIDFPIVNCAVALGPEGTRICLNAVYGVPYRAVEAERLIMGRQINDDAALIAADAAVSKAQPSQAGQYKVEIARALVKRTLLGCGYGGVIK